MIVAITDLQGAVLVGLGATLFMDLFAHASRIAFGASVPDYCLVGRWLRYMPGRFTHRNILDAASKRSECVVGWVAHYIIGIGYALLLVLLGPAQWLEQPALLPALFVGVATVLVPYFVMQPCFGFGIAAARSPSPTRARLRSLSSHTSFGVGLYVAAVVLGQL